MLGLLVPIPTLPEKTPDAALIIPLIVKFGGAETEPVELKLGDKINGGITKSQIPTQ